jgi:hypothetical protein
MKSTWKNIPAFVVLGLGRDPSLGLVITLVTSALEPAPVATWVIARPVFLEVK